MVLLDDTSIIFEPSQQCAEWCINQSVVLFNNAEISLMVVFGFVYVLLVVNSFAREFKKIAFLEEKTVSLAKYMTLFGLILYLTVFKYKIIPLLTGG